MLTRICSSALLIASCSPSSSNPEPARAPESIAAAPASSSPMSTGSAEPNSTAPTSVDAMADAPVAPTGSVASGADPARPMNHRNQHGGVLKMALVDGVHLHIETAVLPSGRVAFWPTDAQGAAIPPNEIKGSVTCEREDTHAKASFALEPNAVSGAAEAQCPALVAAATKVAYALTIRGTLVTQSLSVPRSGTASSSHKATGTGVAPSGDHHGHAH